MNARSKTYWLAASIASIVFHFVAFAVIAYLAKPEPFATQKLPKSHVNIETQNVERVAAQEAKTEPEAVNEGKAVGNALTQENIPISKASPIQTAGLTVSPNPLRSQKTIPTEAPMVLASRVTPQKTQLTTFLPETINESPASLPSTIVGSTQILGQVTTLLEVSQEESLPISPRDEVALIKSPLNQAVLSPPVELLYEQGQASLAWSGEDSAVVEGTSLSAIQAFMQPSDLEKAGGGQSKVRDGIATILASVPCARLQAIFLPETGQLELLGHIPENELRAPVLASLAQQVGSAIPIIDRLLVLPRPQCGALSGIADVGLPQSTEQVTNPRVIGVSGFAQNYLYKTGERLSLELTAPDYDSFVYVDFFTADGLVIHLQPNEIVPLEYSRAEKTLSVGTDRAEKPSLKLIISPPYGQEIAAAFASSVVLYEGLRPLQEPAQNYLSFLKSKVAEARVKHRNFKGEWVYFIISTTEK